MFKTRAGKRIIGCNCITDDPPANCCIGCRCPESPLPVPDRPPSKDSRKSIGIDRRSLGIDRRSIGMHRRSIGIDRNSTGIDRKSMAIDRKSIPPDSSCSCDDSSPDRDQSPLNLQDLQPEPEVPTDWRKCGQYLQKFTNEYKVLSSHIREIKREIDSVKNPNERFRRRITRKYPGKEFSFEVRSTSNGERSDRNRNKIKPETVDRYCQCSEFRGSRVRKSSGDCGEVLGGNDLKYRNGGQGRKSGACKTAICECRPEVEGRTGGKRADVGGDGRRRKFGRNREKRTIRYVRGVTIIVSTIVLYFLLFSISGIYFQLHGEE